MTVLVSPQPPTAASLLRKLSQRVAEPAWILGGGLAVVLGLRALYLYCYGWDPNWMGFTYLIRAKELVLHGVAFEEPPLTAALVVAGRAAGLSAAQALGAIYLVGHALFFLGTMGLARFLWPGATSRRQLLLVLVIATVPILSAVWGHGNLGPLLAAGLFVSALALAVQASGSRRRLAAAAALMFLAAACRFEGLAAGVAATLALALRVVPGVAAPRRAALALFLGIAVGVLVTKLLPLAFTAAAVRADTYAFYTFYDGLPFLLWPDVADGAGEYERYLASVEYFGTYAEHGGSLVAALLANPGMALLRVLAKVPDMFGSLVWLETFTPLGVWLALRGMRAARLVDPTSEKRTRLLLVFLGPLLVLFVPSVSPHYFLGVTTPLVLWIALGLDSLSSRWPARFFGLFGAATLAGAALLIALFGRTEHASSPVVADVVHYLEARCGTGCLTNVQPQAVERQAWVQLDAGAPLPVYDPRSEELINDRWPADLRRSFPFAGRIARARAAGFTGPILYLKYDVKSARLIEPTFDAAARFESTRRPFDLSRAEIERVFERGEDRITVYRIDQGPAVDASTRGLP